MVAGIDAVDTTSYPSGPPLTSAIGAGQVHMNPSQPNLPGRDPHISLQLSALRTFP